MSAEEYSVEMRLRVLHQDSLIESAKYIEQHGGLMSADRSFRRYQSALQLSVAETVLVSPSDVPFGQVDRVFRERAEKSRLFIFEHDWNGKRWANSYARQYLGTRDSATSWQLHRCAYMHEEEALLIQSTYQHSFEKRRQWRMDLSIRRADNAWRRMRCIAVPVGSAGMIGVMIDITHLHSPEELPK